MKLSQVKEVSKERLFRLNTREFSIPHFEYAPEEDAFDQIELLGFPLFSAFCLTESDVKTYVMAHELRAYIGQMIVVKGYFVHAKPTTTSKGERMYFGTFLDEQGDWLDTVHFPPYTPRYPFSGVGVYRMKGVVIEEFGFLSVDVRQVEKVALIEDPRYTEKKMEQTRTIVTDNSRKDYWSKRIHAY